MFIINPYIIGTSPDPGFIFLIDQDGVQLTDEDGEYLQEPQ